MKTEVAIEPLAQDASYSAYRRPPEYFSVAFPLLGRLV